MLSHGQGKRLDAETGLERIAGRGDTEIYQGTCVLPNGTTD